MGDATDVVLDPPVFLARMTGTIPMCPRCQEPTRRTRDVILRAVPAVYTVPTYDEDGELVPPSGGEMPIPRWTCLRCGFVYRTVAIRPDLHRYLIRDGADLGNVTLEDLRAGDGSPSALCGTPPLSAGQILRQAAEIAKQW